MLPMPSIGGEAVLAGLLALLLSGCEETERESQDRSVAEGRETQDLRQTPAPVSDEPHSFAGLQGNWQVSHISGVAGDFLPAIGLNIQGGNIAAQSGCVRWGWSFAPQAPRLLASRPGGPVCERGRLPHEAAFETIMNEAEEIAVSGDGQLLVRADAGSIRATRI